MKRLALAILAAALAGSAIAQPLGTTFTYQGRLTDAGNPASGAYDFQFVLMDAPAGGSQVGPLLTRDDVVVTNGLFTVPLDFGAVFAGAKRWLDVGVRAGASTGAYSILSPRQELTPAPNAAFSLAAPWTGISGKPAGFADDTDNDTTYTAGSGLALVGTIFSLSDLGVTTPKLADGAVTSAKIADATVALADLGQNGCTGGQVVKWNGSAWACAADASGTGTVTSVTAGTGLTGGTITEAGTLGVSFAGGGAASTVARSDHNHFSQFWTSNAPGPGLTIVNTGGTGFTGYMNATTSGSNEAGVVGISDSTSSGSAGVAGYASASSGTTYGVFGRTTSLNGIGVYGYGFGTSGGTGVRGESLSSNGIGGFFRNTAGGPALATDGRVGIGILTPSPTVMLDVNGLVRSMTGGFRFPDGTTQTSAAANPLADITGVTAGTGLTGGGTSGDVTVSANLAGSGSASTIARSDHDHFSQAWTGSTATGLTITNAGGAAVRGLTTATGATPGAFGSSESTQGMGVHGHASATTGVTRGVFGEVASGGGVGVYGSNNNAVMGVGVLGTITGSAGDAVRGNAPNTTGSAVGVAGNSASTTGKGMWGTAYATSGQTFGVIGSVNSLEGFGGYFENLSGGPALGLSGGGIRFQDGTTQTTAAVGDITGVTAGAGLTGGAASGNASLNVNFGGSGTSTQAARANHDHVGGFWTGPGGLYIDNTNPGEPGFWNDTLYVQVIGSQARAILGYATPTSGQTVGVWGQSDSVTGFGVLGYAPATTGVNYGVYGRSDSPTGYAGFFEGGQVGIPHGKLTFGTTARQVIDLSNPFYGIGVQGGVVYFRTEPPGGMFTWFLGGSHSNTQNDPGPGGVRQMRLDGGGNLFVRGTVNPGGADFAEMLPAEQGLEPGDVLAIGPDGQLTLTTTPYQDSLAGVYSTKPGLVGGAADGESTEGKAPLAVSGVVPVKVTDEGGPILAGDSLTSSSTPGHAMKAAKVRVSGISFFPSGVVIGKALEPLHSSTGVIRALVVLQ